VLGEMKIAEADYRELFWLKSEVPISRVTNKVVAIDQTEGAEDAEKDL